MLVNSLKQNNSDILGAAASGLCILHCIFTPFIFIAQTSKATHVEAPIWWGTIDIFFIIISFFAVYWSTLRSSKTWMKYALWISWIGLCLIILNEKIGLLSLAEFSIYIPALALIGLHFYNQRYCKCENE